MSSIAGRSPAKLVARILGAVALTSVAVFGVPLGALANGEDLSVAPAPSSAALRLGGPTVIIAVTVANQSDYWVDKHVVTIQVPLAEFGVRGSVSGCGQGATLTCVFQEDFRPRTSHRFDLVLRPPTSGVTGDHSGSGSISVLGDAPESGPQSANDKVTVSGSLTAPAAATTPGPAPPAPSARAASPAIPSASAGSMSWKLKSTGPLAGRVVREPGGAAGEVFVVMVDGKGNRHATYSASGAFEFHGSAATPVAPGLLTLSAHQEGYLMASATVMVAVGQSERGVRLTLTPISGAATATSSPGSSHSLGWQIGLGGIVVIALTVAVITRGFRAKAGAHRR